MPIFKPVRARSFNVIFAVALIIITIPSIAWWNYHTLVFKKLFLQLTTSLSFSLVFAACIAAIATVVFYPIYKYYKKNPRNLNTAEVHSWLVTILRYWLAFSIAVYGYGKILERFFVGFIFRDDIPAGKLAGVDIVWYFFGYSYKMTMVVALCQVLGGMMLLFKRTTLAGICLLLPVMLNVIFINIYYINIPLALINSLFITLGLVYLLWLRRVELQHLLFAIAYKNISYNNLFFKWVMRFAVAFSAFACVYFFMKNRDLSAVSGKWKVEMLIRNGLLVSENAWLSDAKAWKNIYIEGGDAIEFSANPYIFDDERSVRATYRYEEDKKYITLQFYQQGYPATPVFVTVGHDATYKKMTWRTIIGSDTLKLTLAKAEPQKH